MYKAKKDENNNALRFITAYNTIDSSLRSIYNFKRSMTYADMIRRASNMNYVVRKYEDKLIDYGRLRNAIVHSSLDEVIIAEPHIDVVEEFEKVATLLSTPPKALSTIATRDVITLKANTSVCEVLKVMSKSGYKNIPIYQDGTLIGIANAGKMAQMLGSILVSGQNLQEFVTQSSIGEFLTLAVDENYYVLTNSRVTIEQVMNLFNADRKLLVVLITQNGNNLDKPLGIITVGDVVDMNKILDLY